jgi:DNA-directed RNA polymerase subunit F
MDLQTRKIEFVQEFLKIQSEEIISQLESLLKKKMGAKDVEIQPMSPEELNLRIDRSEHDFKNGKFRSGEELLSKFKP